MDPNPGNPELPSGSDDSSPKNSIWSALFIVLAVLAVLALGSLYTGVLPADSSYAQDQYNQLSPNYNSYYYAPDPNAEQPPSIDSIVESMLDSNKDLYNPNTIDNRPGKSAEQIYQESGFTIFILVKENNVIRTWGTGVVLKSPKHGYCVLTAQHVIKPPKQRLMYSRTVSAAPSEPSKNFSFFAYFQNDAKPQPLELINSSENYDAALLKFSNPSFQPLKTAVVGCSSLLIAGSPVTAIGSSGLGMFWVTTGHLFAKSGKTSVSFNYSMTGSAKKSDKYTTVLFADMPLFGGFSGGPMLNKQGELVGIAIAYVATQQAAGYTNMTIGLPIDDLKKEFQNAF